MRPSTAIVAAAAALVLLPAAQACTTATDGLNVVVNQVGTIPYAGNVSVPVTADVGCATLLTSATNSPGSTTVTMTVAATGAPPFLTVTSQGASFDVSKCAGAQCASATGTVGFAVAPSAPGVELQSVNLTSTLPKPAQNPAGTKYDFTQSMPYNVSFHASYTVTPSITFPATVTGKDLNFTVTVKTDNNARGMVMVENLHASAGSVKGIGSFVYDPGQTRTFPVTFTAPDGAWTSSNVTFHAYTHFLLNGTAALAGAAQMPMDAKWEFRNPNPGVPSGETSTKKSPAAALPLLLTVLGAALVARVRKSA